MGEALVKFWEELIKQEANRYEAVLEALSFYLDKNTNIHGSKPRLTSHEEAIK